MVSSWWARSCLTTVGRPKQARALMWRISNSIGRPYKPPVRKVTPVLVGAQQESAWKSSLPQRSVPLVRCAATARASSTTGRVLHVRPQAAHQALQTRRHEQETPAFRQAYRNRADTLGTLSQAVRGMGIRRSRYDGWHKTHLQHVFTAVAINVVR